MRAEASVTAGAEMGVELQQRDIANQGVTSRQGQAITLVTPELCLSVPGAAPSTLPVNPVVRGFVDDAGLHVLGAMAGRQDQVRRDDRPGALSWMLPRRSRT